MYATIDIHFKAPIRQAALLEALGDQSDLAEVIAATAFAPNPRFAAAAIYAAQTRTTAVIVIPVSDQELQVHIENTLVRNGVSELKSDIARVLRSLEDAAKASSQNIDRVELAIFAEDNRITAGRRQGYWAQVWERFRDTVIGDTLALITPIPFMLIFGVDKDKVGITIGVAVAVVVIWLLIEARKKRSPVKYEDI